jgi:anti-sigma regulatory factor (Ser/Thr protein kinase)
VLDVAKIEAGSKGMELTPCDLSGLVTDVIDMMRKRAETRQLSLLVVQAAKFPRYIRADAAKLRQVLINLVDNAIKYTEEGSVTLRLDVGAADRAGRLPLTFCVEDTGIGIGRADQARIFEAFVQIGKAVAHKGTGLGLTITRQFVELMGGTIHVESTPGEGSRFRVELSLEPARASEIRTPRAGGERVIGLEAGEPEYRILVVDDERENRSVMERLLQNAGFQVRVVPRRRAGSSHISRLAAALHLDGSTDARDGRSPGNVADPRARRRTKCEDCGGHRLGVRQPAE